MPSAQTSAIDLHLPGPELQKMLKAVYNSYQRLDDPEKNRTAREDFVFHMGDWLHDLEGLSELFANPTKFDRDAADQIVFGFLIHAVPHLMAATRLLNGKISDPFADDFKDA